MRWCRAPDASGRVDMAKDRQDGGAVAVLHMSSGPSRILRSSLACAMAAEDQLSCPPARLRGKAWAGTGHWLCSLPEGVNDKDVAIGTSSP